MIVVSLLNIRRLLELQLPGAHGGGDQELLSLGGELDLSHGHVVVPLQEPLDLPVTPPV